MGWTTLVGIYIIVWWVVLFAVLPFGVRAQHESGEIVPGSEPGAPALPRLLVKVLWTTIVTTIVVSAFYAAYAGDLIDLESFATLWGLYPR